MARPRSIPSRAYGTVADMARRGESSETIARALADAGITTSRRSVQRLVASLGNQVDVVNLNVSLGSGKTGRKTNVDDVTISSPPKGGNGKRHDLAKGYDITVSSERDILVESIARLRADVADDCLPACDRARSASVLAGLARRLSDIDAMARARTADDLEVGVAAEAVRDRLARLAERAEADRAARLAALAPAERAVVERFLSAELILMASELGSADSTSPAADEPPAKEVAS